MIVVLDANAGIEVSLDRAKADSIRNFLDQADRVITSELYKAETTNVMFKYVRSALLNQDQAIEKLNYCDSLVDEFIDIANTKEETLLESIRTGHSSYDLFYLTVARRFGARLLTLDKKLNDLANSWGLETGTDAPYYQ